MHELVFSKWQGTGNDFVVVDDRSGIFPWQDGALVQRLCDRHFGIGSDGLILVQAPREKNTAYHMEFFNPDGSQSFCGNGSRCAFAFWSAITSDRSNARFSAIDGEHGASWDGDRVSIGMRPVSGIRSIQANMDLLHTGSPHLVIWVKDPAHIDLVPAAREHRYNAAFGPGGVNVNYVCWQHDYLEMRTYERGVEAETLSCGTGVTAAALSAMHRGHVQGECPVRTPGGDLRVRAVPDANGGFSEVALCGPALEVFTGSIRL